MHAGRCWRWAFYLNCKCGPPPGPGRSIASTALSKNARRLKIPVSASIDDIHTLLVGRDIAAGANESSGTAPYSPVANSQRQRNEADTDRRSPLLVEMSAQILDGELETQLLCNAT